MCLLYNILNTKKVFHIFDGQIFANIWISHYFSILSINHVVVKEELQRAVDEVEATLEAEEGKGMRTRIEDAQIRAEIEKRLQEKEV